MTNKSNNLDYSIQALQRGMTILDTILDARCPLSLEDIYKRTGLVKSTAFRVIVNLVNSGYLTQTDQGYWLGLKILRLGVLYQEKLDIEQLALPFLKSLRDKVNETVHLAVLDNNWQVVYVEKLLPNQAIGVMMSHVGITSPIHCTGLGKVLMAFQDEEDICSWLKQNPLKTIYKYNNNREGKVVARIERNTATRVRY